MIEYRSASPAAGAPRLRSGGGGGGRAIQGLAAVYDTEATIGGMFVEQIAPRAFAGSIADGDVRALYSHDHARVLGRHSAGTLWLGEAADGLHFRLELSPRDPDAVSVREKVGRGDVTGASIGFVVEREQWQRGGAGRLPRRRILRARLLELSPVGWPAYPTTQVTLGD